MFSEYRGIMVFIEQRDNEIQKVSMELLGKARELAGTLGVEVTASKKDEKKQQTIKSKEKVSSKESHKEVDLNAKFHIVQKDETLYSIARMYKTTPEKLSELNDIKQNKIVVGKKLKLK